MNEISIYNLNYIVVPKFIFTDNRLNPVDIKVSALLYSYSGDRFTISNRKMANMFNVSESTIIRSLRSLEEYGYIRCEVVEGVRVIVKTIDVNGVADLTGGGVKFDRGGSKFDNPPQEKEKEKEKEKKKSVIKENKEIEKEREREYNNIIAQEINNVDNSVDNFVDNSVNNFTDNSNQNSPVSEEIQLNERECGLERGSGSGGMVVAGACESEKLRAFSCVKKEPEVNWENCKTDIQRFIAFWIKIDQPNIYYTATKEQVKAIYGLYAKYSKVILDAAGDLEVAKEAASMCRDWLVREKLSYNIATVARNITKFIDAIVKKNRVPVEVDYALWEEYCKLRELKKGAFDKSKVLEYIKNLISHGKNPNELLERKILELKRDNSDVPDFIRNIKVKTINEEVK